MSCQFWGFSFRFCAKTTEAQSRWWLLEKAIRAAPFRSMAVWWCQGTEAEFLVGFRRNGFGVQHKQPTVTMDKINPKDCQVASPLVIQGFSNFLGLFQVIMAVYTTYIPLIVLAFWGIICYRSHLLREPGVVSPLQTKKGMLVDLDLLFFSGDV